MTDGLAVSERWSADVNPTMIRAVSVEREFGAGADAVHALGPIEMDIVQGEFVSVVGPSGCGKSTLVKVVGGLLEPTAGVLQVRKVNGTPPRIATVFQDFGIFPWKTVERNVSFALRVAGVGRTEAAERTTKWLKRTGLSDFAGAYPSALSGGMRQRVAIARALAVEPDLLLMDEPFAALDAQLRQILQDELLSLWQETRPTVIFVTHSLEEAILLSDRVVVMSARPGKVCADRLVPFGRPRDASVRQSAEFTRFRGELWDELGDQVHDQLAAQERGNTSDASSTRRWFPWRR